MARVLLVEDEELISTMVKLNLERAGFEVEISRDAEGMLDRLNRGFYDILLIDIMLPGMSGEDALGVVRRQGINMPVIMLTAKRDTATKVHTLSAGADDFMAKPFDMEELLARVRAQIRRSQGDRAIPSERIITINGFEVNLETRSAQTAEGPVQLSEKELDLLNFLAQRPGRTLSRLDILEEVWGMDVSPTPRTIDNFIARFRRLFKDDPDHPRHFITVRSIGYRFES